MSILTRTGERAKHRHLLGLLEGVRAAPLKSKVLSPAYVHDCDNAGFIDKTGSIVLKTEFDEIFPFPRGLPQVWLKGERGYIDRNGKVVWKPTR